MLERSTAAEPALAPYLRALAMCRVRTTAYYRGRSGRKRCRWRVCPCLERSAAREPYVALKPARADTVHVYRRNMGSRAVDRSRVVHSSETSESRYCPHLQAHHGLEVDRSREANLKEVSRASLMSILISKESEVKDFAHIEWINDPSEAIDTDNGCPTL